MRAGLPLHLEQESAVPCEIPNLSPEHHTDTFAYFQWCAILSARLTL